MMTEAKRPFWSTLPGILAAAGTAAGATAGLVTALYTAGILSPAAPSKCTAPFIGETREAALRGFLDTMCENAELGIAEAQYKLAELYREG
jgi:hypothetical protein